MLILNEPIDFAAHTGANLGATEWLEITQEQIDGFAELTGDDHWIHVDVTRAARERPACWQAKAGSTACRCSFGARTTSSAMNSTSFCGPFVQNGSSRMNCMGSIHLPLW